jgi:hypothetical protein
MLLVCQRRADARATLLPFAFQLIAKVKYCAEHCYEHLYNQPLIPGGILREGPETWIEFH